MSTYNPYSTAALSTFQCSQTWAQVFSLHGTQLHRSQAEAQVRICARFHHQRIAVHVKKVVSKLLAQRKLKRSYEYEVQWAARFLV